MSKKITYWSHRGYKAKAKPNSLKSLIEAYKKGYRHIELDLWYLDKKLLLGHNKIREKQIPKSLSLDKFLKQFGNKMQYWMDFKNLDENNIKDVLILLKKLLDANQIPYENVYFTPYETNINKDIVLLKEAKKFIKKINIMAVIDADVIKNFDFSQLYKFYSQNQINHFSVENILIDKEFIRIFNSMEIYAWVVNDKKEAEKLETLGVRNICTDSILPE